MIVNLMLCRDKIIRPFRFSKPERSIALITFMLYSLIGISQNKLQQQIDAKHIESISINGNQIFSISIVTSNTNDIKVLSVLDGEYQNDFQLVIKEENKRLILGLEPMSLAEIPDDKRNAHKVIAATLRMEIPEHLALYILSDIGSVELKGNFKSVFIELEQGQCYVEGYVETARINTLEGDIGIKTKNARVVASSNHGKVIINKRLHPRSNSVSTTSSQWELTSINGNITVVNRD